MNKKKVDIESTEPINRVAEIDEVVAAFEKRGGYITIEEDFRIRKRISNRAHLSYWIGYVKSKLVYKKQKIEKHVTDAHASIKGKIISKVVSSPIAKPLVKVKQEVKAVIKRSLNVNRYSDIYKDDPGLRPYQQKAKKEIFESWDEVDNVMLQMPTGIGKTRLFTSIISDINNYSVQRKEPVKILIVAHRTELIDQIDGSLDRYHVPHSVIGGRKKRNYRYPVIVASIQTITHSRNLDDAKKLNVQFVIIDEAHHALAATYKQLWDLYPDSKKLGVTATPWRMNHQSFMDLFNKLVVSMPIKDFIRQGYLAPYKYFSLRSDSDIFNIIDKIELDKFGEYKESSMEDKMDIGTIRAQLLDSYLTLAKGKKGIIYAINIVHAKHICREYQDAGYNAVCIDSKTSDTEREKYVSDFRKGKIDIIVNVDIFSEGFDCPDIEFIQLARPTRSLVKYLQQVGRGLRPTDNKEHCIILDNVGMYFNFGLPDANRPWELFFLGTNAEEELQRAGKSSESESERFVDFSEGTEEMELIQDVYDDVEVLEQQPEPIDVSPAISKTYSAVNDFFPILGVTLGKTTWQDIRAMGYKVKKDKIEDARYTLVEKVAFWDNDGEGIFNSLYWVRDDNDFPTLWKSRGFSWEKSYDEWMNVFKNLGYNVTIKKQATINKYTLVAEFEALSPDGSFLFDLYFNDGTDGCYTSSHKTLYSITVECKGLPIVTTNDADVIGNEKKDLQIDYNKEEKKVKSYVVKEGDLEVEHVYVDGTYSNSFIDVEKESDENEETTDFTLINKVFDRKATSYKYFWFLAILKIYNKKRSREILFKDILVKMVTGAWEYVFDRSNTFSKLDMLPHYLKEIQKIACQDRMVDDYIIEYLVEDCYTDFEFDLLLAPLLNNVPYRFLSPWIPFTSNEDVAAKSNDPNLKCPYALQDDRIIINPVWGDYFLENYEKLKLFTEKSLRFYLKHKY